MQLPSLADRCMQKRFQLMRTAADVTLLVLMLVIICALCGTASMLC